MDEYIADQWKIKNWYLISGLILSAVLAIVLMVVILPKLSVCYNTPANTVISDYSFYILMTFLLWALSKKTSTDLRSITGSFKKEYFGLRYFYPAFALLFISMAGIYLIYYPLSFVAPGYTLRKLEIFDFENYCIIHYASHVTSISYLICSLFIVPIIEELFFRGFFLTSLAKKWGISKAVIISSIVYGILSKDPVGSILFGVIAAILYLKTKSLFVPVVLHSLDNVLYIIMGHFFYEENLFYIITIESFQNSLWIPAVGAAIGIPWLIYFYRKEVKGKKFSIPYFENLKLHEVKVQQ